VRFEGHRLPELGALSLDALAALLAGSPVHAVSRLPLDDLRRRLGVLCELGLSHLSVDRAASALSSGELQRLRLARQLGSGLSGVLYVLDEPTAGLSGADLQAVVRVMSRLRDLGNTVIVVDHHREVIEVADRIVEFGPGPGVRGGRVVYDGDVAGLYAADTATGRWMSGLERFASTSPRAPRGALRLEGAGHWNLCEIDVDLPVGALSAITGPSGSGKTTLLETLRFHVRAQLGLETGPGPTLRGWVGGDAIRRLIEVDRRPLARTARSSPATYIGMWEIVRELLASTREARVRGLDPSYFSLHAKGGRCEACQGTGLVRIDLGLLPDVYLSCEVCGGRRFNADVLEVAWKGRSADQILDLSGEEAYALLAGHPRIEAVLRALLDVGLGYLPVGQPAHTLSGGEAQRLRLARELTRRAGGEGSLYLVDDPTVGLHPADVDVLLRLFHRLADDGSTVVVATHDRALAAACDHEIALGPGAGPAGGRRLYAGRPQSSPGPVDKAVDQDPGAPPQSL
jgi:excinuclease ABC subunit A